MRYYDCGGYPLCGREVLALPALHALPEAGEVLFGFHRTPGAGRDTFPVTAPSLLTAEEGVSTLVTAEEPGDRSGAGGGHSRRAYAGGKSGPPPDRRSCCRPLRRRERVRVNLLALGDVGSTLLMGAAAAGRRRHRLRRHLRREGERSPAVGDGAEPDRLTGGGEIAAGGDRLTGGGV